MLLTGRRRAQVLVIWTFRVSDMNGSSRPKRDALKRRSPPRWSFQLFSNGGHQGNHAHISGQACCCGAMRLSCLGSSLRLSHNTHEAAVIPCREVSGRAVLVFHDASTDGWDSCAHTRESQATPFVHRRVGACPALMGRSSSRRSPFKVLSADRLVCNTIRAYLNVYNDFCGAISLFPNPIADGSIWRTTNF